MAVFYAAELGDLSQWFVLNYMNLCDAVWRTGVELHNFRQIVLFLPTVREAEEVQQCAEIFYHADPRKNKPQINLFIVIMRDHEEEKQGQDNKRLSRPPSNVRLHVTLWRNLFAEVDAAWQKQHPTTLLPTWLHAHPPCTNDFANDTATACKSIILNPRLGANNLAAGIL
ncbi:unnamed protein product, partial [Amoebophrya sp. A120]|eukprot:GSA120T00011381001.1